MLIYLKILISRLAKIFAKPEEVVYKDHWRTRGLITSKMQAAMAYAPSETMTIFAVDWSDGTSEFIESHKFQWHPAAKAYLKA